MKKWFRRIFRELPWRSIFADAARDARDALWRGWVIMIGVGIAHHEVWPEVRPIGFTMAVVFGIISVAVFPPPWRQEESRALSEAEAKLVLVQTRLDRLREALDRRDQRMR